MALVTSAWHLMRAERAFRQVGLAHHVFVAIDFRGTSESRHAGGRWPPTIESAFLVCLWLKEWVGKCLHQWKGWWRAPVCLFKVHDC